ncbi:MAG TPA: glycoside hydrolase family 3 N-terminal domain-containing protein [Vicinamibacteria bacterium]|nr:glycoside hydrolase family 3 N-terminal domain-containing protein [Vicinamibacteria bacterium]
MRRGLPLILWAACTGAAFAQNEDQPLRWARETLRSLSLREKAAQMVCEQIRGGYLAEDSVDFRYWSRLAEEYGIGGFVVYGGSPRETAELLNRLQKRARVPILVSADFEGGPGQQFQGASEFPANMALSAIGDEKLAYDVGRVGALEGRAIGIHLTYSPSVDVQTLPDNPVLGVRSFGSDLDLLSRMAGAYIRGYQENGMLATAKHYPGRGDVTMLDDEFLLNGKPETRIEAEDLRAFRSAIDAGVAFVMSEHIQIPALTGGSELPASVEPKLASFWLRDRLGFQGVLTTDDLWYPKVVKRFGGETAGVMAIQAGHDVLLKPANAVATIEALVSAVETGAIPLARVDASVEKLLRAKARLGLHENRYVDVERIASVVGTKAHRELVREVAERSLTILADRGAFPTSREKLGKIVYVSIQKTEGDPAPLAAAQKMKEGLSLSEAFLLGPGVDPARYDAALAAARGADTVLVGLFHQRNVYRDGGVLPPRDHALVRSFAEGGRRTIVLSFGNPYLARDLPEVTAFVVGYGEGGFYGNQLVYADAFLRLLRGEIRAEGKSPVSVFEAKR